MQKKFDEIRIEDLEVFANHGVFPEENTLGQKFVVSAVLFTDTRMAGKTSVKNSQREDRAWLAHSIHCVRI